MLEAYYLLTALAGAAIAFALTYLTMPWLIRALTRAGLVGPDLHKKEAQSVPLMGGIGVFAGFATAMTLFGILPLDYRLLFAVFLSATLAVLAGLIDDLFRLGKLTLVVLTFLIGIPVVAFRAGSTLVYLTPFGPADLGWAFWALVPFAFAFLMNGVNIYAGFNGLEAGLGFVSSTSLGICALLYGSLESAVSLFALSGALLAFLKWNWYPARVFIGGSGTYLIGAVLASSVIAGTIKVVGVIALFPYLVNFILRASDRFRWTVGETLQNGLVKSSKRNALWALIMHNQETRENRVVGWCILIQTVFGLMAVIFGYYHIHSIAETPG